MLGRLIAIVLFASTNALAASPTADLAEARRLVEVDLRFSDAIGVLRRALADPNLTRSQRVEGHRLLATAYVASGSPDSAEAVFWELLRIEPAFELDPMLSPKIHRVFERAKKKAADAPRLSDFSVEPRDGHLEVSGQLDDPRGRVHDVELHVALDDGATQVLTMERAADGLRAEIPGPLPDRLSVHYHVTGHGPNGRVVARHGTDVAPLVVVVQRIERPAVRAARPWYEQWWVWGAAAAVVAAGVTTAVVLSNDGEAPPPAGTLDLMRLD